MIHLTNHLWQSTNFAAAVALTTMALHRNSARLRYWLWLAASLKFLIPFSVLVTLGGEIAKTTAAPALPALPVERVSAYFAPGPVFAAVTPAAARSYWSFAIVAIWVAGTLFFLLRWHSRWFAIRKAARSGRPLLVHPSLPLISSRCTMEPGVFGVFRPILLLPEGIADSLSPEQFQAILAHELCHVRYRDNLTGALHMCVETLFWFHPVVWWIGAKLVEERERACDECVLTQGNQPTHYAQGIVNVCKTWVKSPLPCVSGITGAGLRKRIRRIMTWRGSVHLSSVRKSMLAAASILIVAVPLVVGVIRAQTLPPPPGYTYDVVSINKSKPGQDRQIIGPGPGRGLRAQNTTVIRLVSFAYKVPEDKIGGAPAWVSSDRFDVSFTPAKGEPASGPGFGAKELEAFASQNGQRMQAVLRDRFGLVLRVETHELPIYALVPAKGGLKLTRSVDPKRGPSFNNNGGRIMATGVTLRFFAAALGGVVDRTVVDETGSDVAYDIKLEYSPETTSHAKPDEEPPLFGGPSIFTALTDQLGLRLESRKGPVPTLVIEKIRRPDEN